MAVNVMDAEMLPDYPTDANMNWQLHGEKM